MSLAIPHLIIILAGNPTAPMLRRVALLLLTTCVLSAAPHTFTDQVGRTIVAEITAVQNGQVTIRRTDGQSFTLAISTFSDDDQKYINAWTAAPADTKSSADDKPVIIDPKKFTLSMSRGKFDSHTLANFDGYSHKHEDWGYSIQISNEHLKSVGKIRIEYNVFARTYPDISGPTVVTGSKTFDAIKSRGSETFRTRTAMVCKRRDIYFGNESGELRGIWIKLYVNDQLISEQSSPETLMNKESWSPPNAG
ncbi:MAG TPA: hypothetical protein VL357_02395 [Rariglobus sp.]|jgi:hypothetical protein|nr:hypothetical protein [Rariglobus sp.]